MPRLGLYEMMKTIDALPTKTERVQFLQQIDCVPLRRILRYAYSPRVKWILPDGEYSYKPLPQHEQIGSEQMYWKEARTCYLFVEGDDDYNPNVRPEKRRAKFIELLENMHPEDSEILYAAFKERRIPYENVTAELVREAFPNLLDS